KKRHRALERVQRQQELQDLKKREKRGTKKGESGGIEDLNDGDIDDCKTKRDYKNNWFELDIKAKLFSNRAFARRKDTPYKQNAMIMKDLVKSYSGELAYNLEQAREDLAKIQASHDLKVIVNDEYMRIVRNLEMRAEEATKRMDEMDDHYLHCPNLNDCRCVTTSPINETVLQDLKKAFMDAYDNNKDGRIDIRELAQLLPLDESFMLLFRFENQVDSNVEFMRIWAKYDTDSSGYIDSDELKNFLRDLLFKANKSNVTEDKLEEYTQTLLKIFDQNRDGKLQLSEMTRLLMVKQNFLQCSGIFRGSRKLTKQDIESIFNLYDTDHNGIIENEELKGFIKDIMDFLGKLMHTIDDREEAITNLKGFVIDA
ncbi:Calbindin-32, partial [Fragariocoptes setiger]